MRKPAKVDGNASDGGKQKDIDNKMNKLLAKFPDIFSGIGKVKTKPIHIHMMEKRKTPVARNYG